MGRSVQGPLSVRYFRIDLAIRQRGNATRCNRLLYRGQCDSAMKSLGPQARGRHVFASGGMFIEPLAWALISSLGVLIIKCSRTEEEKSRANMNVEGTAVAVAQQGHPRH
jgi:hypothetical protein